MLIDLTTARAHIRDDAAPADQVQIYLRAAELSAEEFLNRRLYADQVALQLALSGVSDALIQAGIARDAAVITADTITDSVARDMAIQHAGDVYRAALYRAQEIQFGMVATDLVKAAVLLIFGHLYANREDSVVGATVAELPQGSRHLLQPYRKGLGV